MRRAPAAAVLLLASGTALGALPTAVQKKAFFEMPAVTLSFEFVGRMDTVYDPDSSPEPRSHHALFSRKSAGFAITLDRRIEPPRISDLMHLAPDEARQEGRFVGWEAAPASDPMRRSAPAYNPSRDPGLVPVRYAVEESRRNRFRHAGETTWTTFTSSTLGQGVTYLESRAILTCDLTRVACWLSLKPEFVDGADTLTVTSISDEPGARPDVRSRPASSAVGALVRGPLAAFARFEIDLPAPVVKEIDWSPRGVDPAGESTRAKVTIAAAPAPLEPPAASTTPDPKEPRRIDGPGSLR